MNWTRIASLTLALYWIALATATHVPKLPTVSLRHGDKIAHYLAYSLLGFALSWAWATRRPFFPVGLVVVMVVAIAYGAVDELTQIPVPGRYGEWYDWFADSCGAVTGVLLFWAVATLFFWLTRRVRRTSSPSRKTGTDGLQVRRTDRTQP
jgi:VanZ family protein